MGVRISEFFSFVSLVGRPDVPTVPVRTASTGTAIVDVCVRILRWSIVNSDITLPARIADCVRKMSTTKKVPDYLGAKPSETVRYSLL
jgi:hypothetical protein